MLQQLQRSGISVPKQNIHLEQSGRGNNWAYGWSSEGLAGAAMESVRREAEACDSFEGCILTHSLGGGTGAGLGSRLLQELREELGCRYVASAAAAPFHQGSPLQSYNTVLALTHIDEFADCATLFHNEDITQSLLRGQARKKGDATRLGFGEINRVIGLGLAGALFPVLKANRKWRRHTLMDLVTSVCPYAGAKLIEIWSITSSREPISWASLVQESAEAAPRYGEGGSLPRCLAASVVTRGGAANKLEAEADNLRNKLCKALPAVRWNPMPYTVQISSAPALKSLGLPASSTVCLNRAYSARRFKGTLDKAQGMFDAGAYLHWYQRHGCEEDAFLGAFEALEATWGCYEDLTTG